eukprot:PhF_6_TR10596/c0_g1_i1/m.17023
MILANGFLGYQSPKFTQTGIKLVKSSSAMALITGRIHTKVYSLRTRNSYKINGWTNGGSRTMMMTCICNALVRARYTKHSLEGSLIAISPRWISRIVTFVSLSKFFFIEKQDKIQVKQETLGQNT